MSNVNVEDRPVNLRLLDGARVLGNLWRKKDRCKEGWRILLEDVDGVVHPDCPCEPQKSFCKAKIQWAILAVGAGRDLEEGPFGLATMMTVGEIDALSIPVKVDIAGVGEFKVGTGGNASAKDLVDLARDPESAGHILGLMKAFPGSKMSFLKEVRNE